MQHESKESGMTGSEAGMPASENAQGAQAGFEMPQADAASFGTEQLRQIIDALQTENDKLRADFEAEREQGLRLRAEMDNMRKRTEREKADTAKYAIGKFAGDIVNVADNFERALKSVPEESITENPTLKALQEGVAMTEREFLKVLEKHGVRRCDPTGEIFNPHQHQAVMEQENADVPTGTVLQVFQSGYLIEDRVLRPAMVVVSRGGQKPAKPAEPAAPLPSAGDGTAANEGSPPDQDDGAAA